MRRIIFCLAGLGVLAGAGFFFYGNHTEAGGPGDKAPQSAPGISESAKIFALVLHFGAVWQCADAAALSAFVARHRRDLHDILLFEVAHEGAATPAMHGAARLGGLTATLSRWLDPLP